MFETYVRIAAAGAIVGVVMEPKDDTKGAILGAGLALGVWVMMNAFLGEVGLTTSAVQAQALNSADQYAV